MSAAKKALTSVNHPSHPIAAMVAAIVFLRTGSAAAQSAQPLRLRGDALVQTRSPVGLVVLNGQDRRRPWLDVETVTWLGGGGAGTTAEPLYVTGDVLTLSVRARDMATGSEVRVGRMVVSMGAIRPVHVDGARGLFRAASGTTAEAFAGFPVMQRFDYRTFDWTAGGRLGQAIGDAAAFGGSYSVRKTNGQADNEEVGADLALTPSSLFTMAGRASFDLSTRGLTDALASTSVQGKDLRGELFTTHRSPGRLLPSTSLFSVLGDFAATSTGSTVRWRAAPRLEVLGTGSVQVQNDEVGGQGLTRVTLALDDMWSGSIGLEGRRVDFNGSRWTGVRAILALPLKSAFRIGTELELVRPDDPRGRGDLWPWALVSVGWTSTSGWDVAAGVEASSGPEYRQAIYALARLSCVFDRSPRQGNVAR